MTAERSDSRGRHIRASLHALADLRAATYDGFATTDWGGDNGCKALLHKAHEMAADIQPLLVAAQALDRVSRGAA